MQSQHTTMSCRRSSLSKLHPGCKKAVVISFAKGDESTKLVYCLKVESDKSKSARFMANPFRLHNKVGRYIWPTEEVIDNNIEVGSIILYRPYRFQEAYKSGRFLSNTRKKLETSKVLSLLQFRVNQKNSVYGGMVYHGIEEAFPNAVIAATKGIYQETRPTCRFAMISISHAVTFDDRIFFTTRACEMVNLSNRTVHYASNSIKPVNLPVQDPSSEEDVGGVVLVGFGSKPLAYGRYQAFCEGILCDTPRLERYSMSRDKHGLCIIINNLEFQDKNDNRYGGEFDEAKLVNLFENLSFFVRVENDLKYNEIMDIAEEYASQDHTDFDAFVMIVMSHGGDGDAICGVSGKKIGVKELMAEFKVVHCPSLENKPKIFIFEACRRSLSTNVALTNGHKRFKADAFSPDSTLSLSVTPPEADFLLAFATTPGNYSWRDEESGSLYVQVLEEVIRERHQHHHLLDMLTEVNRRVAERASNQIDSQDVQIPAPVHTLRAQVYL